MLAQPGSQVCITRLYYAYFIPHDIYGGKSLAAEDAGDLVNKGNNIYHYGEQHISLPACLPQPGLTAQAGYPWGYITYEWMQCVCISLWPLAERRQCCPPAGPDGLAEVTSALAQDTTIPGPVSSWTEPSIS